MIRSVRLSAQTVRVGDELRVDVSASHPTDPSKPCLVWINGVIAGSRVLRFEGPPGLRDIYIAAFTEAGRVEAVLRRVTVLPRSDGRYLSVRATGSRFRDLEVDFVVTHGPAAPGQAGYDWNFGDGQIEHTTVPFLSHDFSKDLDASTPYLVRQVRVTEQASGLSATVTVSLRNTYAFNRRRGLLQPLIRYNAPARRTPGGVARPLELRNLEAVPLRFDTAIVEQRSCDARAQAVYSTVPARTVVTLGAGPVQQAPAAPPKAAPLTRPPSLRGIDPRQIKPVAPSLPAASGLVVPAGGSMRAEIQLDGRFAHSGTCVVGVHLLGSDARGTRARADVYLRTGRDYGSARRVGDKDTVALLDALFARDPKRREISTEDLYRLELQGRAARTATGWKTRP